MPAAPQQAQHPVRPAPFPSSSEKVRPELQRQERRIDAIDRMAPVEASSAPQQQGTTAAGSTGPDSAAAAPALAPAQTAQPAQTFEDFIAGVRADALRVGLKPSTLDAALTGLTPDPVVVARDRAQPELTQSLDNYLAQRLSPTVLANAKEAATTHRELLSRVEAAYGVAAPVMVAVWGMESNFGRFTGTYATVRSLATLAYDGRRPLFRTELISALTILDRGVVRPDALKGSWAGAMGQPQFMPSSFLRHAVDFDADNVIDIWTSPADVLGSMANYLKNAGWVPGERWGREVRISPDRLATIERQVPMRTAGCRATRELTQPRPLAEWAELGVRLLDGSPLPTAPLDASLVKGRNRYFLVYRNYFAFVDYNCSNAYAVAVGLLSDRSVVSESK